MKKNVFYFRIPESVDENFINDFENKLKWNEMQISQGWGYGIIT